MYCDKCDKNVVFISGQCTSCNGGNIRAINDLMLALGVDLVEAFRPIADAMQSLAECIPDEKQIARQRSRDDLQAKRKQSRRGGNMYRSR